MKNYKNSEKKSILKATDWYPIRTYSEEFKNANFSCKKIVVKKSTTNWQKTEKWSFFLFHKLLVFSPMIHFFLIFSTFCFPLAECLYSQDSRTKIRKWNNCTNNRKSYEGCQNCPLFLEAFLICLKNLYFMTLLQSRW